MMVRAAIVGVSLALCGAGCQSAAERCDEERTRERCEAGCEAGDAKSCHRLAKILDGMPHLDPALASSAFQRSCELGSAYGCMGRRGYCAGARADGDPITQEERACRQKYTQAACDLGDKIACRSLPKPKTE